MKSVWKRTALADVLQKTETVNPLRSPESEFDYIDVSGVSNRSFQIIQTQRLKGKDAPSRARRLVNANDVLFATIRPTLQRIAIVPEHLDGQICSTAYVVLRAKPDEIDHRFLFHLLFTEEFTKRMESLQKGASYPAVTDSEVRAHTFALPPLGEQRTIVDRLDEALNCIVTAKNNAEQNRRNAKEMFNSYIQSVFLTNSSHWSEKRLGDEDLLEIIDGDRGANYPKSSDFSEEGYCLFLNTKNVRPDGFDFTSTMFVSKKKDEQLRKGKLKRDDVVLTTRGTIGNIGHYSNDVPFENVRINSGMLVFRPNKKAILPGYLFEMLRSEGVKDQIRRQTTGAAQPQLPIKILANFKIPVPASLDEQMALVERLQAVEPEAEHLSRIYQQKVEALDALKRALLHQSFNGSI